MNFSQLGKIRYPTGFWRWPAASARSTIGAGALSGPAVCPKSGPQIRIPRIPQISTLPAVLHVLPSQSRSAYRFVLLNVSVPLSLGPISFNALSQVFDSTLSWSISSPEGERFYVAQLPTVASEALGYSRNRRAGQRHQGQRVGHIDGTPGARTRATAAPPTVG